MVRDILLPLAPKGLSEVLVNCGCGSNANEDAFKIAFAYAMKNRRGGAAPSAQEIEQALNNKGEQLSIVSFRGAFHGRSLGALSSTHSKAIHKIGSPRFDWPAATFPDIKYPYHENEAHNTKEENRSLDELEKIFKTSKKQIAGVIIEPILAEGGDKMASPTFYLGVQEIAHRNDALFIVDEVQTGGGSTGKFWAHTLWGPRVDPDIVTFAKKLQVSGLFYKPHLRPQRPFAIYNTSHGDPVRLLNLRKITEVIATDDLLRQSERVGMLLKNGLIALSNKYPISNVRGHGLFLSYDLPTPDLATQFVKDTLSFGVNVGTCGERSIRVRPSLIFETKHANIYLDRVEYALKESFVLARTKVRYS